MCVVATVPAAVDLGYECLIVHDASATWDLQFNGQALTGRNVHPAFLAALNGIYGRVVTADTVIAESQGN